MLWEKRDPKNPEKGGYLYLRETLYIRDKRSLTRKPRKLGSGKAYENRSKYSKKKDIYCGKIVSIEPKHFISYQKYLEDSGEDYTEFKINSRFDNLLDSFIDYLLYINEIDKEEFQNGNKIAYSLANGFLSRETISFIKRFQTRGDPEDTKEIQRFSFRCEDSGIFDEDIIMNLYIKLIPTHDIKDIKEEIDELNKKKLIEKQFKNFRDYMRKEYE